ncbi:YARHG domain-containing protein [Carboxylicivirga linearis]|uniref:YARHG domain-containing protein n=1 Tax=Carboxylicivirga linearis TaxID=1628157 RepID=A0ABS5K488_9BACT|nr:YARHG domain-containing protein [Carboxylicivirga linearis]MBS2101326.1 YARHG domain-containing protein [Carboxylicivirga linearis]
MKERFAFAILSVIMNIASGLSQVTKDNKNVIPPDFPSNYIVEEYCPSCETPDSLIFYPDRTFIFRLGGIEKSQEHYEIGIWRKEGNLIMIDIYKNFGIRPVGEPTNPNVSFADNPDDYFIYEEYVPYEEWVSNTKTFDPESLMNFETSLDTSKASLIKIDIEKYLIKGDFKVASCRLLNNNDLKALAKSELRLMRNEIFARYGYKFKSIDLQKHFLSKDWYHGNVSNVDSYLTDIEKKNIELISIFEQK